MHYIAGMVRHGSISKVQLGPTPNETSKLLIADGANNYAPVSEECPTAIHNRTTTYAGSSCWHHEWLPSSRHGVEQTTKHTSAR